MMETALVFDHEGRTIHWHEPLGRSGGSIPDSRDLWSVLWEHRSKKNGGTGRLAGVAHTHPWDGPTGASRTDLTTFRAVELGLGQRILWPIVTFTHVRWWVRHADLTHAALSEMEPWEVMSPRDYVPGRGPIRWGLNDVEELRGRSRTLAPVTNNN